VFNKEILDEELPEVIKFLSTLDFFKKLDKSSLADLASSMSFVFLEGGETLINEGDLDATLYTLYSGRLRVFIQEADLKKERSIAEISVGEIVGEIALLTNSPRTSTVRAIRDSLILKLDRKTFQKFELNHPEQVCEIAKASIKRLITKSRSTQVGENIITIAVAPAGSSNHKPFFYRLYPELVRIKPTILVTPEVCDQHFGRKIAQAKLDESDNDLINNWLISLESLYGYVVYQTDRELTPWTQRCLRQADRILFVVEKESSPAFNEIEMQLHAKSVNRPMPYFELVFVHPDGDTTISGSSTWLKTRHPNGFHHLRLGSEKDVAKLTRFLTGRSFGVVFSGGGVRAIASIGALQVLEEMKIPVDFIGGTSMGGFISAVYAKAGLNNLIEMGKNKDLIRKLRSDYTLPLVSLLKGKNSAEFLEKIFDDIYIEDLSMRYFCVSANLTEANLFIHDRGILRNALSATMAAPAIFPPVYDEHGDTLVDGGIINNMPVDIMRKLMGGGKILAVKCYSVPTEKFNNLKADATWVSGWDLLFKNLNPFRKEDVKYDNIFDIVYSAITLSAVEKEKRMAKESDYLLEFDTSKYGLMEGNPEEIFSYGLQIAKEKLPQILVDYLNDRQV